MIAPMHNHVASKNLVPVNTVSKCAYYMCCVYYTPEEQSRMERCQCCKEKKEVGAWVPSVAPIDIPTKPVDYPADR